MFIAVLFMEKRDNISMEIILKNLARGKKPAFEKIFHLYYPRLIRYANSFISNRLVAEDLIQDVFFHVWENRSNFYHEKAISSYLITLVKNKCLNVLKHQVVEDKYAIHMSKMDMEKLYYISFETDDFLSMEERLHNELEDLINEMPDRCAQAFKLKWLEGKKIKEIAEIMNISTTMVDKHLAKGLQIVRSKLSPDMYLFLLFTKD